MRSFGKNPNTKAEVFAIHATSLSEASSQITSPTKFFTVLIACDSDQLPEKELSDFAKSLLEKGAVYVCVWGKGCSRFHDIIDLVGVDMKISGSPCPAQRDGVLMTTWHEKDPLDEALWFLLSCAWPTDDKLTSCSTIAITIGNQSWANEVNNHLEDIEKFFDEMCDVD